ncbi:MAG: hypothetical protein AABW65_01275 [Nanoarchaeota archaeon]
MRIPKNQGVHESLYNSYIHIARGTSQKDLADTLQFYESSRSLLEIFLQSAGFRDYPSHIKAFKEVYKERAQTERKPYT